MSAASVESVSTPYALKFSPKNKNPKKTLILFQTIVSLNALFYITFYCRVFAYKCQCPL